MADGETWVGTPGPDDHNGTRFDDELRGVGGDDVLVGRRGR